MAAPLQPEFFQPEFSRIVAVERLGGAVIAESVAASAEERARLIQRLGLAGLESLTASVRLWRAPATDLIHVTGRLEADVVQTCVVSLQPFPSHVEDSFAVDFSRALDESAHEVSLDMDDEPPEPLSGGTIDIGELVAQYLSLALDPYPRAPGAALPATPEESDASPASPFAILQDMKRPR